MSGIGAVTKLPAHNDPPPCLTLDWILGQFGIDVKKAKKDIKGLYWLA